MSRRGVFTPALPGRHDLHARPIDRKDSTVDLICPATCRRALAALVLGTLSLAGMPAALAATPEQLADIDAKAEYAFFTADARALAALVAANEPLATSVQALERYQYAHAEFRRLQVAWRQQKAKDVEAAGSACLEAIDKANETDPHFVEGLALEAACAGYLGALGGLRGAVAQHRSEARLAAARELAPRNPRVLLVEGFSRWFRAGAGPAERAEARKAFERAARAFETVTATAPGEPSWGEAEAWLFIGRSLEASGDLLGARNAYEKSLLIAPEFAAARRGLQSLRAAP
jgi:tetratricopeptide (TPR) repeat protein